jgi:DNA-3-methyladenine glycosylase
VTSDNSSAWLPCEHFARDVIRAAMDLIGRTVSVRGPEGTRRARIVETEAYGGRDDPASHAAFRPGGRASLMAGEPGRLYVYAAYGMYPCLNIVVDAPGVAAAVLLRGAWFDGDVRPVLGPGRLSKALEVTLDDHGTWACAGRFRISAERLPGNILATSRVGVTRGADVPWRFVAEDASRFNSR